jgi:transcriptional regulator with XRE-family HTH domain
MPRHDGTNRQYLDLGLPQICRRLEEARARRGWTKRELGRTAGVDEKQAGKLLDPRTFGEPQLATMRAVVRALGLSLDGLFGLPATAAQVPGREDPISYILIARGWTAAQLGAEAGLSHGTIPALIAGKARPDLFSAIAIARAGGVSLDSLAAALLD